MNQRVVLDPAWMRTAARNIDDAAAEAARGNADMQWLLDAGLTDASSAAVRSAYRSTRSAPNALRDVARQLRQRADLIERNEATVTGGQGLARISASKWLRALAMNTVRSNLAISGPLLRLAAQARDYAHLADKAKQGTFWGNFCGSGNKGVSKTPADTLDACCKTHDLAYAKLGIDAKSQFTPTGLMKTANANQALSACAARQPDGTERGDIKRFDPSSTNRLGIDGDDARSGVAALFALMAIIGYAIAAAHRATAAEIDKIPFISRERADELTSWAMDQSARAIIAAHKPQLDALGALV